MRTKHFIFGLLAAIAVSGCGGGVTARGIAQIRAISAVSNPSRIDVFTDFNLVASDLNNGEGVPYSNQTATVLSIGVRQFGTTQTLASGNISAGVNEKYTLFPHQTGANTVGIIASLDDAAAPASAKFKARIVHVDRFVGAVDLYVVDTGTDLSEATPVITAVPFQGVSAYVELDAGVQKDLVVTLAGTTTVVGDPVTVTMPDGAIRTLMFFDNSGPSLNIYND